ncbi:MAG: M12 family metallo-peptidase, partial [Phycisphaerales bacterium JB065]
TYRGQVAGQLGSTVAASVIEGRLEGTVWLEDGTELWFGNVSDRVMGAPHDLYAVYNADDVLDHGGTCGGGERAPTARPSEPDAEAEESLRGNSMHSSILGLDADAEFYQLFGSTELAQAYMEAVINTVNMQYERDVEITHRIGLVIIRTSVSSQPYTSTDSQELLSQFRNEWNANVSTPRGHAHLFSGKDFDGSVIGRAWVGAVCSTFGYGISQVIFSSNLTYNADLVAHELGHNWDADHCNCSVPSYTMNSGLTGANRFHPSLTRPEIIAYRNSVFCDSMVTVIENDHCANAIPISDGLNPFSTVGATTDGRTHDSCGPNSIIGNDIWFTYTAHMNGILILSTCEDLGGSANFDTDIAVYNALNAGCPPDTRSLLACNDNDAALSCGSSAGGFQSTVRLPVITGQELLIRVGGFSLEDEGEGQLFVDIVSENDDCSNPFPITAELTPFSTLDATTDGIVYHNCGNGGWANNDLWYTYTAPHDGTLIISTCEEEGGSADFDTNLMLYSTGGPCPTPNSYMLACNNDDTENPCGSVAGGRRSTIRYEATAGEEFLIRVGGNLWYHAGTGVLMVRVAPYNDHCADAIPIDSELTSFSNIGADTDGLAHPDCQNGNDIERDIWYRYTAPCSGTLMVSTCEQYGGSANFDTNLAVYAADGASCPPDDSDLIACNDDDPDSPCGLASGGRRSTVIANVENGEEYLIRVGSSNFNHSGTGALFVECTDRCTGDLDGNGVIDLGDLNSVLANFGAGPGGDANGDGITNLTDLNIVLAGFGSEC